MKEFNRQWSDQCEIGGDDFDEREPFQELLDSVDCYADASSECYSEGAPGQSSKFAAFYVDPDRSAPKVLDDFKAYGVEKLAELASHVEAIKTKLS